MLFRSIAVRQLQSIFWLLLVTFGALGAYLVSLRVATERNDLDRVRAQVAAVRADTRYLETEFAARSSMRQLEKWNADDFRYAAPTAAQYLEGERALASLDRVQPNGPVYVAPPVMTAMVESPADLPSAAEAATASPAASQIRSDISIIKSAEAAELPAKKDDQPKLAAAKPAPKSEAGAKAAKAAADNAVARHQERMAMLDAALLGNGLKSERKAKADR